MTGDRKKTREFWERSQVWDCNGPEMFREEATTEGLGKYRRTALRHTPNGTKSLY